MNELPEEAIGIVKFMLYPATQERNLNEIFDKEEVQYVEVLRKKLNY